MSQAEENHDPNPSLGRASSSRKLRNLQAVIIVQIPTCLSPYLALCIAPDLPHLSEQGLLCAICVSRAI